MLIGQFKRSYEKQNGLTVFVYDVIGTSTELQDYKTSLGEYYREENDIPYFSTPYYVGKSCPFIKSLKNGNYLLDNEKLRISIVELKQLGYSFYNYLHERDKDPNWLKMVKNEEIFENRKRDGGASDNNDNSNKKTFGNYKGTYAQDYEGYSDEDIDDIFGGDPDMYWNID